ncbi:MAG TPA: lasso peptide biosynthesis B2 protein [Candidatus Paenibacillus intestinavium]|nr:lasso peptide biosynthesis B2 protein [Candidatus Paenibacillus intestinavium]
MNRLKESFVIVSQFILLVFLDVSLRLFGFPKTFGNYVLKYNKHVTARDSYSEILLENMLHDLILIDRVCSYYPFEAKCLHRSFLGYRLLCKKYKVNVELVIGVRKFPFYAHAWLKCDGLNINEQEDVTEGLITILSSHEMRYNIESILR